MFLPHRFFGYPEKLPTHRRQPQQARVLPEGDATFAI
jgi:hypothetical protein